MDVETLTPDAEESAMRELGVETDAAQGREPVEAAVETPKPQAPEPEPTPEPAPPPQPQRDGDEPESPEPQRDHPQQRPRDPVTGKFEKPETPYSKAQKEEIRKERTWRSIQAEKEQIRADKAQWEEHMRMQQLEATRQQYQPLKKDGLTAQEYAEGARRFELDGDFENAYKAHKVAQDMFQAEQGRMQQMQGVEAEYQWRMGMQQAIQMRPDIGDANSPIAQHLERIISQNPWIYHIPNGFLRAAEVADMLTRMSEIKEKEDEIIKLRADLERFQKKSQPARGGFASPRTDEKDFDDMDLNEMEAHLKGITAEADNYR